MNYLKKSSSLVESIWSLFKEQDERTVVLSDVLRTVDVRYRMIETLESNGLNDDSPLLRKVINVSDAQGLWFLRPEVMQHLSLQYGEQEARSIMGNITPLFAGLVPQSLYSPTQIRANSLRSLHS
jgi:hypothetical protein